MDIEDNLDQNIDVLLKNYMESSEPKGIITQILLCAQL